MNGVTRRNLSFTEYEIAGAFGAGKLHRI
jgi:hypothetical protein